MPASTGSDSECSTESEFEYEDAIVQTGTLAASPSAGLQKILSGMGSSPRADEKWFVRVDPQTGAVYYESQTTQETTSMDPSRISQLQNFVEEDIREEQMHALIGYSDAPGGIDNPHFCTDEIIQARQRLSQWIARENVAPPKFVTECKLQWYVPCTAMLFVSLLGTQYCDNLRSYATTAGLCSSPHAPARSCRRRR